MLLHDLRRRVVLAPDDAGAREALGEALLGESPREAIEQLEEAVRLQPERLATRTLLAHALLADGRLAAAEQALREAVRRDPQAAAPRDALARVLRAAARPDDALLQLEEASRLAPDDVERRLELGEAWLARNRAPRARVHLEHARNIAPRDERPRQALAALDGAASATGLDDPAWRLGRARATAAGRAGPAWLALTRGDLVGAKRALLLDTGADAADRTLLRGEIHLVEGQLERAEGCFLLATAGAEPPALAWTRLGELRQRRGALAEAASAYERGLASGGDDTPALVALGEALLALGRTDEGMARLRAALEREPDPALALRLTELASSVASAAPEMVARVGVLGYTSWAGCVSPLEAVALPGEGRLHLTGNVGSQGREAAEVAWTCVKATRGWGLGEQARAADVHVHYVDAEFAKDGASAGLGLFLAQSAAVLRRPLPPALGATGQIALGRAVLRIGGLHEKAVAAALEELGTVLLPRLNFPEAQRLPPEVPARLKLVFVDSLEDALRWSFGPPAAAA